TIRDTIKSRTHGFSMRMASMFMPTMSDKTQMLMLKTGVFNFMKDSVNAFDIDADGNVSFKEDMKNLLYTKLVLPELKRIMKFHRQVGSTNIKDYDNAAQIFHLIPELNNVKDEDGIRLIKHLAVNENITLEDVERDFKDALVNVVEN